MEQTLTETLKTLDYYTEPNRVAHLSKEELDDAIRFFESVKYMIGE